jgi:hypothetical protein
MIRWVCLFVIIHLDEALLYLLIWRLIFYFFVWVKKVTTLIAGTLTPMLFDKQTHCKFHQRPIYIFGL